MKKSILLLAIFSLSLQSAVFADVDCKWCSLPEACNKLNECDEKCHNVSRDHAIFCAQYLGCGDCMVLDKFCASPDRCMGDTCKGMSPQKSMWPDLLGQCSRGGKISADTCKRYGGQGC
ncbi:MAG: hypothetical protein Q7T11_00915 [Deltaproteobacteria bacterium]|nr:hypothetical protein [Deltaproteobacteria bacterium]